MTLFGGGRVWIATCLLVAGAFALAATGCRSSSVSKDTRLQRMQASPQYRDGRFVNALPVRSGINGEGHMYWNMLRRSLTGDEIRVPEEPLPIVPRQRGDFTAPPGDGLRLTWLGHASVLIEIDGYRVLTDPVWATSVSPISLAHGSPRFFAPPIALSELPPLDAVLISHDHYDHLDRPTIIHLNTGTTAMFYVPLGVGARLEQWGVSSERIVELDWWQEHALRGLKLVATPARHFSGRSLFDGDATLWSSWALIGPRHRVFFSGDTGMFPGFAEIGQRHGPFDATLIETGGYSALWADVHLGPEQAVQAHQALRGRLLVPIHWGTFSMAMHGWTEPVERLAVAAKDAGVAVAVPRPGESVTPGTPAQVVRWWPAVPWQRASEAPVVSSGTGSTGPPIRTTPSNPNPGSKL